MTTAAPLSTPFISVLMSCYNASRWLDESIQSILNQSYGNFEFIIVNDGSTDCTQAIIQRYASSDDRIVMIAKANTGLADSLNVGISRARGVWIARQDADDVSDLTRLEKQVRSAMINHNIVFLGTGLAEIDELGRQFSTYRYPLEHSQLLNNLHTAQKFPPHSSAFYRSDVVRSIGGYRPRFRRSQDRDLWLRLSEVGELACLDEPLVKIRIHPNQISNDEAGRRQQIDSRVAMTSYWLRQKGVSDPVDADDKMFNAFYTWLEQELLDDGLFEIQGYKRRLKMALKGEKSCASDWVSLAETCLIPPSLLLRFLHEYLWGDSLAAQLAKKWINIKKTCI